MIVWLSIWRLLFLYKSFLLAFFLSHLQRTDWQIGELGISTTEFIEYPLFHRDQESSKKEKDDQIWEGWLFVPLVTVIARRSHSIRKNMENGTAQI